MTLLIEPLAEINCCHSLYVLWVASDKTVRCAAREANIFHLKGNYFSIGYNLSKENLATVFQRKFQKLVSPPLLVPFNIMISLSMPFMQVWWITSSFIFACPEKNNWLIDSPFLIIIVMTNRGEKDRKETKRKEAWGDRNPESFSSACF